MSKRTSSLDVRMGAACKPGLYTVHARYLASVANMQQLKVGLHNPDPLIG